MPRLILSSCMSNASFDAYFNDISDKVNIESFVILH